MALKGKELEKAAAAHYEAVDRFLRKYETYAELPKNAKEVWRDIAHRWHQGGGIIPLTANPEGT